MPISAGKLRRLREAAIRDRDEKRFFRDLNQAIEKKEITWRDLNIRELYENFVPNGREIVASWNPNQGGGYQSINVGLLESVGATSTAAFIKITGATIFNHVLDTWNGPEFIGDKLVKTIPSSLMQEIIPGVGRIGDATEDVPEMGEYPMAGLNEESVTLPVTQKRGFQIALTKEMVYFDRMGLVIQRAENVTYEMRLNKEKRIIDMVFGITNPYIRNDVREDTYTTSGVVNQAVNPLVDWQSLEAAEILFSEMVDPNTGELITTIPSTLVVPTGLKHTARRIVSATQIEHGSQNGVNEFAVRTQSNNTLDDYEILSSPQIKARTGSNTTYVVGDPQRAFVYVENWPISVEEMPIGDRAYSHDLAAGWKGSERGVCGVMEKRHVAKFTAS